MSMTLAEEAQEEKNSQEKKNEHSFCYPIVTFGYKIIFLLNAWNEKLKDDKKMWWRKRIPIDGKKYFILAHRHRTDD